LPRLDRRTLFYWNRSTFTSGYWIEATTQGLSTETLSGSLTNSATSFNVTANTTNPIKIGDRINLGEERMSVSNRISNTLTVIRGVDGTQAVAHSSGDKITRGAEALVDLTRIDTLHNPQMVQVTFVNPSENIYSTTASQAQGRLTDVFKQFMKVILLDKWTHQIFFAGYIKDIRSSYNIRMGKIINLSCSDILDELVNFPGEDVKRFGTIAASTSTGISAQIQSILLKTDITTGREVGNALDITTDVDTANPTLNYKIFDTSTQRSSEEHTMGRGSWNVLQHLDFLANLDSHESATDTNEHSGYDFYVSPNFLTPRPSSGEWGVNPNSHFNYFKRGSRPNTSSTTHSLTVKFPNAEADSERNTRPGASPANAMRMMFGGSSFNQLGLEIATSAIVHYNAKEDVPGQKGNKTKTKEFELLYCYALQRSNIPDNFNNWNRNAGLPIWEGRATDIVDNDAISGSRSVASGGSSSDNKTINTEENPVASELLYVQTGGNADGSGTWTSYDSAKAVARLQWLSHPALTTGSSPNWTITNSSYPTNSNQAIEMLVNFDLSDEPSSIWIYKRLYDSF